MSKKPRLALIGTGWAVRVQLPSFRAAGWDVTVLWARTEEKAKAYAAQYNIPFGTSSYDEVLANNTYDLISIVTPPVTHAEWAIKALEKGKNVLCDKPTSLNAQESREMLKAAKKYPNQLSLIDHELRFLPSIQRAREWIKTGAIGDIRLLRGTTQSPQSRKTRHDWWYNKDTAGGMLTTTGCHVLDILSFMTGFTEVTSVKGLTTPVWDDVPAFEDKPAIRISADLFTSVHLTFGPQGVPGVIQMSIENYEERKFEYKITGTKGAVYWSYKSGTCKVILYKRSGEKIDEYTESLTHDGITFNRTWDLAAYLLGKKIKEVMVDGKAKNSDIPDAADFAQGHFIQTLLDSARHTGDTNSVWKAQNV